MQLETLKSKPVRILDKIFRYQQYFFNRYIRATKIAYSPIYIVGCGHSGTTLLLSMLDVHSKVHGIPFESSFANKNSKETQLKMLRAFDRRTIAAGKLRWVEKTPGHIHKIQRLLSLRDGSKVIVMIRDGRDVACSLHARPYHFEDACRKWVDDNKAGQQFSHNENVIQIKYEELITDLDATLHRLMEFLQMEFEESMLSHNRRSNKSKASPPGEKYSGNIHKEYRNWQISQPVFDGRNKWKKMMTEDQKKKFKEIANDMLIHLGYVANDDW